MEQIKMKAMEHIKMKATDLNSRVEPKKGPATDENVETCNPFTSPLTSDLHCDLKV
ncbi:hypothetical protein HanPSC8_Chr14g0641821 [Helianthus annuus]|nr:hypothetical protein HanPSC8_Chr14g0641821 [Helianthus annuus]